MLDLSSILCYNKNILKKRGENLKLNFKEKMEKVKFSFRELWKAFTQTDVKGELVNPDIDTKQVIEQDSELSENDKKLLLNSMKNREKLEKKLFKESLEVGIKNNSKAKKKEKSNKIEMPVNAMSNDTKKRIAEEKAEKIQQDMDQER